jgi:hypothetical protein
MSSNKSAREELERIYGKKCMICQGIRTIYPPKVQKGIYKGKSIAKQLTYHHLVPKSLKGQTNVNNGAILCTNCHRWLESLPKMNREQINNELREYKREHSQECTVVYVDRLDVNFKVNAFVFTPEELQPKQKYNRAKDKREYQKRIEEEKE